MSVPLTYNAGTLKEYSIPPSSNKVESGFVRVLNEEEKSLRKYNETLSILFPLGRTITDNGTVVLGLTDRVSNALVDLERSRTTLRMGR